MFILPNRKLIYYVDKAKSNLAHYYELYNYYNRESKLKMVPKKVVDRLKNQ